MVDFEIKDCYKFDDLLRIMEILRAPDGCMWDREQDHHSIRRNFIEETYEVCEAIDDEDTEHMKEELGDVLLQVVFHTQMEKEKGTFDIDDVADGICKKLIFRHPHIFGNVEVASSEEVLRNWDDLKRKEKHQETDTQALESVAKSLPSLIRAEKLQKKAAKVGFDWDNVKDALDKVQEELDEVRRAIDGDGEPAKSWLTCPFPSWTHCGTAQSTRNTHKEQNHEEKRTGDAGRRKDRLFQEGHRKDDRHRVYRHCGYHGGR